MRMITALYILLLFIPLQTTQASTSLPFMPEKDEGKTITPVSTDSLFGSLLNDLGILIKPVYGWGINIITALFIVGTVVMILSVIFKNGQWQKYGQNTMFFSFVVMLILRGLPVIVLSIKSESDIDMLLSNFISTLTFSSIFLGLVSIAVSFLFRNGYRLIEHPDFHRWSRNLLSVSVLMMIFATIIPFLFPTI